MLGNGILVRARRNGDGHAALRGSLDINGIVADAGPGNDPQRRICRDDPARVRLRPGKGAEHSVQILKQLVFAQLERASGINQLETSSATASPRTHRRDSPRSWARLRLSACSLLSFVMGSGSVIASIGYYLGTKASHVGQAFEPDFQTFVRLESLTYFLAGVIRTNLYRPGTKNIVPSPTQGHAQPA